MEFLTIILLLILGIVLLLVELLLIPGLSIAGVGCLLSFTAAVVFSFRFWGNIAGFTVLFSILIFVPIILYYLFKSKAVKPMMLSAEINGKITNVDEQKIHKGDEGTTIGRLAPMGKAKFNGSTVEAKSQGQLIAPNTKIRVLKIEGNTVIVEPLNE